MTEWFDRRTIVCIAVAAGLIVLGTLGTAFLPATPAYQLLSGGTIVAAFALVYLCFRE